MKKVIELLAHKTPSFETFFQAETFLEKKGYECHDERWIKAGETNATVVARSHGVKVVFESTHY